MSCSIDSGVYFYGLLFATGFLITGYRTAVNLFKTDELLTEYEERIERLTAELVQLKKENSVREILNNPSFIREFADQYECNCEKTHNLKNELTSVEKESTQDVVFKL